MNRCNRCRRRIVMDDNTGRWAHYDDGTPLCATITAKPEEKSGDDTASGVFAVVDAAPSPSFTLSKDGIVVGTATAMPGGSITIVLPGLSPVDTAVIARDLLTHIVRDPLTRKRI